MKRRKFIYSAAAITAASVFEPFAKSIINISNKKKGVKISWQNLNCPHYLTLTMH